ncbi:Trihelix transcription factor ASIL2 [Abeliophyllum distichum]|uniref:Trihelix transcription factor ASIL2 n=1 Tax=Abeliophyllum distichum TaxID=126358 RepID=A0ABD1PDK1_9LAMI
MQDFQIDGDLAMEEEDEIQSNGRITVTLAAAPPSTAAAQKSLTLALPVQQQKTPGNGGGREDCWSEGATAVLIDAWGEKYLELSRGNIKQKHWKDVADIVTGREDYTKTPKTDVQCKNRIDTVKKKYKTEKAKIAAGGAPSKWRFYQKMDELIGPTAKINNSWSGPGPSSRVPMGIPVGVRHKPGQQFRKRRPVDSDEESEPEHSADSSNGLPPESYKRQSVQREKMIVNNNATASRPGIMNWNSEVGNGVGSMESNWENSVMELTRAILNFGEAYAQAEKSKLQQLVEMEKQRMKFVKELELQRMQFFMKTQLELSQLKHRLQLSI